jgi:hypothetical protein
MTTRIGYFCSAPKLKVGDTILAVLEPLGKATIAALLETWETVTLTPLTRAYATTACDLEMARHDPFLAVCFEW